MTSIELESTKHLEKALSEEKAKWRQARSEKALHDFATFVFGLTAMFVGVFAVQEQDRWLPLLQDLLTHF